MRYKVNRIGFVNFWLYDEEDFYFCDGKMLLRGTNGSGKTVTMQSFFPLIFDGNKSPERLDPFGSRDRKIEDYLLTEDFSGNENTGYLYMEFYDSKADHYLTIGIGLRAIRNRSCEFWGFALTDNRRIGTDFLLFKERNLRVPLTKKELQSRIGTGGEFVESQKEYKKMVNRLLFGFPTVDMYTEFINLLIQVRSPKLSNSTRPSQLTKILSTVLEPLSEDDLRVMADSIEDMNKYKEKLADLQNEQKACMNLKNSFYEYNKSILYTKGERYLKYKQVCMDQEKKALECQEQMSQLREQNGKESERLVDLKLEEEKLVHRKSKLEETDLKRVSQQLDEIMEMVQGLEVNISHKEEELAEKNSLLVQHQMELRKKEDDMSLLEKEFQELLSDLTSYGEDIYFDDAKFYLDTIKKEQLSFEEMDSYLSMMKKQVQRLSVIVDKALLVYQKRDEMESAKNQYEMYQEQVKETEQKISGVSHDLMDSAETFKNMIAKTSLENTIFVVEQNYLDHIYDVIDALQKDMFVQVQAILKDQLYAYKDQIQEDIAKRMVQIREYEDKVSKLELELQEVDHILNRNLNDEVTKAYFEEHHIDYCYFYELIDFRDHVSIEKRKQIESFLLESGIMTSFVTDCSVTDLAVKARCLQGLEPVEHNLTVYLKPLDGPYRDKVEDILKCISTQEEESFLFVLDGGKYQVSIMEGLVDADHELRYVGADVRDAYIARSKEKLEISKNHFLKEISLLNEENDKQASYGALLEEEYTHFQFPDILMEQLSELERLNLELSFVHNQASSLFDVIQSKSSELKLLEAQVEESRHGYSGPVNYEEVKEVLNDTTAYFELLKQLSDVFDRYGKQNEFLTYCKRGMEGVQGDLDRIGVEMDEYRFQLRNYLNKKQTIEDILNSDQYRDVGKEYQEIGSRLHFIGEEIPKLQQLITRNEVHLEHLEEDLLGIHEEEKKNSILREVAYRIFMDEYHLHYVSSDELTENGCVSFIHSLKMNVSSRDVYEKFNDSVNKYIQQLVDYAPKNVTLHAFSDTVYLDFTNDESMKNVICEMFDEAKRRDLSFNYLGRNVNLLDLSSAIDTSILSYQGLISEENRRLFEDLLINNIGSSIRNKIWQSEEWISSVKRLMESMNTSSGLSFSLKWDGIGAQTEDELDTKEIVSIFKQDADKLKPEHFTKITNHFKSRITMKEEALEESERNYLEIIKDVLDYRKWFEFRLYFKRGNGEKKELTDREFNKMSGGEKAIAMYVPLFSSIYAKLNSAYDTAPRVIALDEAFAGVDDDNIRDAFRILGELDLDYVLTSQQLWGDYDTISHLAIHELYHPIGSNVVSIIPYKWDGIMRKKIEDEREYQS